MPGEAQGSWRMVTNGRTKVGEIYQEVLQKIVAGSYEPGTMLPTQRELSRQFGVSENTAAVAMGRLVHEGLVVRTSGVGSFVNPEKSFPRALGTIHFVREVRPRGDRVASLALIEDLSRDCEEKHYTPVWHHLTLEEMSHPKSLLGRFHGGTGVVTVQGVPEVLPQFLHQKGVPVVAVLPRRNGHQSEQPVYPILSYDHRATVGKAVTLLVSLGYRKIAYAGRASTPVRTVAFVEAVQDQDLVMPWEWVRESKEDNLTDMSDWVGKLVSAEDGLEAICCATEHCALHIERMLLASGYRIPQDVAVMACDDGPEAVEGPVKISAVGYSMEMLCRRTFEMIEEANLQPNQAKRTRNTTMIPLKLTVRDSCGAKLVGLRAEPKKGG